MIDGVVHSIMARNIVALPEEFDRLGTCLCVCFSVEANIAQAVNFDFTQHGLAHQVLLNKFQHMKDWLIAKNGAWSELEGDGCIDSLRNGLIRHIKEEGEPLKMVLETHFYDFNLSG